MLLACRVGGVEPEQLAVTQSRTEVMQPRLAVKLLTRVTIREVAGTAKAVRANHIAQRVVAVSDDRSIIAPCQNYFTNIIFFVSINLPAVKR